MYCVMVGGKMCVSVGQIGLCAALIRIFRDDWRSALVIVKPATLIGWDRAAFRRGQKILINGAGGGVGTFAIQIPKLQDVEVTGVDSAAKLDMMRSLGFDHVIDYGKEDFTKTGKRYDLILDTKTSRSPSLRPRSGTRPPACQPSSDRACD